MNVAQDKLVVPDSPKPKQQILNLVNEFLSKFDTNETSNGAGILLLFDQKSKAFYLNCHLGLDSKSLGASEIQ